MRTRPCFAAVLALLCSVVIAALPSPAAPQPADTLRVVSYNIRHGRGNDDAVDLERTARVLRAIEPDIVGLQEVDDGVTRSGGVRQAARLGELLGMHHAFGRFMDYQGGAYGMAILSRYPIVSSRDMPLPEGNEPRVALAADVRLADDTLVTVVNVHFDWVRDDGFRFAQAETLAKHLEDMTRPLVLLGDFNDRPDSRTLEIFRSRMGEAAKPEGARFTFPAGEPDREIDYIFFSPITAWRVPEVRVIDERIASDHRPVLAVLERVAGTGK